MKSILIVTIILIAHWIPNQKMHPQMVASKIYGSQYANATSHYFAFEKRYTKRDTISIYTKGENNRVVVNFRELKDTLTELNLAPVKGDITQVGQNNSVEIKTGDKVEANKKQIANSNIRSTSNKKPATIKITQTGKNNSVKIDSH